MPLTYQSGLEIRKGDLVTLDGEPGEIEIVADPLFEDPETTWFVKEHGAGVLIKEPKVFGRLFLTRAQILEDCCHSLVLVSRAEDTAK